MRGILIHSTVSLINGLLYIINKEHKNINFGSTGRNPLVVLDNLMTHLIQVFTGKRSAEAPFSRVDTVAAKTKINSYAPDLFR
ncbi:hypothetical protein BDC45DRAFT_440412 [Circinella umbellata]|nr:hypothetical protein BDC45DRAFT_440412 [Circinella umbellata]